MRLSGRKTHGWFEARLLSLKGTRTQNSKQLSEEKRMEKGPVSTFVLVIFWLLLIILVPVNSGIAQNTAGRWVLGLHGGGNVWINDYSERQVGPGGEVMLRYGITPAFSAGILAGYEELKSQQESPSSGQVSDYLKLNAIPASATVWVHFASGDV